MVKLYIYYGLDKSFIINDILDRIKNHYIILLDFLFENLKYHKFINLK